ncbi:VCBS domain-containing protein [Colwellia sp. E2M01]|uniref:VCBS domain-containing protein n=1 Tax=Colwellia sp. E2M01 TaxID=2841561 RepID=UPI001C09EA45|nr:VCBS domain-containing protein [Colwellia sp. E2M01]MBU2871049.1 VCBS domain-containing protein [Colwellia sp. E2M01]
MMNKSLITIALALSLTACGSSDEDNQSLKDKVEQIIEDHGTVVLCPIKSELSFSGAIATAQQDANNSSNAIDGDIATRWSAESLPLETATADADGKFAEGSTNRAGESLTIKLDEVSTISALKLSWNKSDERTTAYSVSTSLDNENWTEVLAETSTEEGSVNGEFETVEIDESIGQYVRITAYGNSALSGWNSLDEAIVRGCTSEEVSIAENVPATFFGESEGAIDSDQDSIAGSLLISDLDGDTFVAQTDVTGTGGYGDFTIDTAGLWTYTLADISAVTDLAEDAELIDTLEVTSTDGEEVTLTVTITGAEVEDETGGETGNSTMNVVQISDTTGDTGELRLKLADMIDGWSDPLPNGKITTSFYMPAGEMTEGAYVGIYEGSVSNSKAVARLEVKSTQIQMRDEDEFTKVDYSRDTWYDVSIAWDATDITVTIGDNDPVTYTQTINSAGFKAVDYISLQYGANSSTQDISVLFGDITLYDDTAGTSELLSTNWNDYTVGASLDPAPAGTSVTDFEGNFHSNSEEAVIIEVESTEAGGADANLQAAKIVDTLTSDAGELRYKLSDSDVLTEGSLTTSIYIEAGKNKSAYIGLFGSSTSTSDAIVDLNIGSSSIKSRDGVMTEVDYDTDTWIPVELSWTATEITVKIGDNDAETYTPTNNAGDAPIQTFIFKLGDNGNVEPGAYYVDDIVISDATGSEVFADDFESYAADSSIAEDPYNGSSNEVTASARP